MCAAQSVSLNWPGSRAFLCFVASFSFCVKRPMNRACSVKVAKVNFWVKLTASRDTLWDLPKSYWASRLTTQHAAAWMRRCGIRVRSRPNHPGTGSAAWVPRRVFTTVNLALASNLDDLHDDFAFIHPVNDSGVTSANPKHTVAASKFFARRWSRIGRKRLNQFNNSAPHWRAVNRVKLLRG